MDFRKKELEAKGYFRNKRPVKVNISDSKEDTAEILKEVILNYIHADHVTEGPIYKTQL